MDIQKEIITLVSANNLKQAFIRLKAHLTELNRDDLIQQLPLLEMRYRSMKDQEMMGLVTFGEASREYLQVSKALMDMVEKLSENAAPEPHIPTTSANTRLVILFLASNPEDTSQMELEKEFSRVSRIMQDSRYPVTLVSEWAVTIDSLQSAILKHKPTIIHFSGHGIENSNSHDLNDTEDLTENNKNRSLALRAENEGGIVLQDANGKSQLVKGYALEQMFEIFSKRFDIQAVILNACYSEMQAKSICKHVRYVIGMSQAIEDTTAIAFSSGFYSSLSIEYDIELSFDLAKNKILLAGLAGDNIPILFKKSEMA